LVECYDLIRNFEKHKNREDPKSVKKRVTKKPEKKVQEIQMFKPADQSKFEEPSRYLEVTNSNPPTTSKDQLSFRGIMNFLQPSEKNSSQKTSTSSVSDFTPQTTPTANPPKSAKKRPLISILCDEDSADFIKIDTTTQLHTNLLTQHQKDGRKKREEALPQLYTSLDGSSRDTYLSNSAD